MLTRPFQNKMLPALGLGCMRFPVKDGKDDNIDEAAVAEMVDCAIKGGVNYFDTAWAYHEGQSEVVMGRILSRYPRESYYLADKFPGYDVKNMDKVESVFEEQLRKTGVDYFDFYLFHNVCEANIDYYLNEEKYGICAYLKEQKANGRIRHLGFSTHGDLGTVERFLDAYGECMEFCQIQLNWLDWELRQAGELVAMLTRRNIPIWVMEPLRGGKLATLSPENTEKLKQMRPDETVPGWAFRFLQSLEGVTVTLSGMSNLQQIQENIRTFESSRPLNEQEWNTLLDMGADMARFVPCTTCRYCTVHCPQKLDIPTLIRLYNEHTFTGGGFLPAMRLRALGQGKQPSDCIGCRSCEKVCPQNIKISEVMSEFAGRLTKK